MFKNSTQIFTRFNEIAYDWRVYNASAYERDEVISRHPNGFL